MNMKHNKNVEGTKHGSTAANIDLKDLERDLQELLIIAHRVANETDRKWLADFAEKWLRKTTD